MMSGSKGEPPLIWTTISFFFFRPELGLYEELKKCLAEYEVIRITTIWISNSVRICVYMHKLFSNTIRLRWSIAGDEQANGKMLELAAMKRSITSSTTPVLPFREDDKRGRSDHLDCGTNTYGDIMLS